MLILILNSYTYVLEFVFNNYFEKVAEKNDKTKSK